MKNTIKLTASLAAFGLIQSAIAGEEMAAPAPAPAPAASALTGNISVGYDSQYSFRGVSGLLSPDGDDSVNASLNFAYALCDQWSLVAGTQLRSVDGFDDHISYRGGVLYTADAYTVELGYQAHEGALGGVDTDEIYLNLGTTCPLTGGALNLFVAQDIDVSDGTYAELSLNKGWDLSETIGLDVTVGVAYSFDYWDNGTDGTGSDWNHAYITVGFPIQATDALTITPYISYSEGFDALDATSYGLGEEEDEFTFGVSASVNF